MARSKAQRTRTFARDRIAWAVLLTGSVMAGMGAHSWGHRRVFDPRSLEGRLTPGHIEDTKFAVLAYDRTIVTAGGPAQASARIGDHLRALEAAGFQPMTLAMLERFLWQGAPLPRRAVLVTFDHGHLATFEAADPVLREAGWPAVMLVSTSQIELRDPAFLYWDRLDKMLASGLWELGSLGHESERMIPLDAEGRVGDFALHREWLADAKRLETAAEFESRVTAHYERALASFAQGLPGARIAAMGFRHRESLPRDPELRDGARRILAKRHSVAFVEDLIGLNDILVEPYAVKRLRVPPHWDGYELVRRLESSFATRVAGEARVVDPLQWTPKSGTLSPGRGVFALEGDPRADGWLGGSTSREEWRLDLKVESPGGQFWISQTSLDGETEWRIGGDASGMAVQVRSLDGGFETLARATDLHLESGGARHLEIVKRGRGVWAAWDGQPLFARPVDLPGRWRGPVGCVSWEAPGPVRVSDVTYGVVPYRAAAASARPDRAEVQSLLARAADVAAVAPLWLTPARAGWAEHQQDRIMWRVLERRGAWEIVPRVVVDSPDVFAGSQGQERWRWLLRRARERDLQGVVVDATQLGPLGRREVKLSIDSALRGLPWQERRVALAEAQRRASMTEDGFLYLPLWQMERGDL